jgi:hypothetical protein
VKEPAASVGVEAAPIRTLAPATGLFKYVMTVTFAGPESGV